MQSNNTLGDRNPVSIKASNTFRLGVMFVLGLILALLTGCATTQKETETIAVTKTVYVAPEVPRAFTDPVFVPPPPKQEDYIKAEGKSEVETLRNRNEMLSQYILKLLPVFKDVNKERKSLRKWSDDQQSKKKQEEKKQDLLGELITNKADKDKQGVN